MLNENPKILTNVCDDNIKDIMAHAKKEGYRNITDQLFEVDTESSEDVEQKAILEALCPNNEPFILTTVSKQVEQGQLV